VDTLNIPIFFKDKNGSYQGCNKPFEKLMGVTRKQIKGKKVFELWPGDQAQMYHQKDLELLNAPLENTQTYEYTVTAADGNTRNVIFYKNILQDQNNHVIGLIGSFLDITDRKRSEEEVHKNKEHYKKLIDTTPSAIFTVDSNKRITSWNKKAEDITGYNSKEVIGHQCYKFALYPCIDKCGLLSTDVSKPIMGKECSIRTKRGQTKYVSKNVECLYDPDGNITGGIESFVDITENKLQRQTLEQFRLALDSSADSIFIIDRYKMKFIDFNETACKSLGYTKDELLSLGPQDIKPRYSKEELKSRFDELADSKKNGVIQTVHQTKTGLQFPVEVFLTPIITQSDDTVLIASVRDVTERLHLENELRQNEQKLSTILQNINIGIALINPRMQILFCNHAMREWFHPGKTERNIFCYKSFNQVPMDTICPGCPTQLSLQDGQRHESVMEKDTVNGKRPFHVTTFPIKDSQGGTTSVIEMVEDISERMKYENNLKNANQEWEATFNSITDMIAIQDKDFKLIRANKAFVDAFGGKSERLIGRKCYEIFHNLKQPFHQCPLVKSLQTHQPRTEQFWEPHLKIFLEVNVSPIYTENQELIGCVHIAKDISERKKNENEIMETLSVTQNLLEDLEEARSKAEQSATAKTQFLANMSHEIRTPMNAILGFCNLLKKTGLTDKQNNYLDTVLSSGNLLLSIINDILDYSKIEAKSIQLESIDFNIIYLVHDVFKIILMKASGKPIDTYIDVDDDLPVFLNGDPTRLRQILINLLGNAMKFTRSGSVGIILKKIPVSLENHPRVKISVKDTGIGIDENLTKTIFEPFSQADGSITRKFGGTGLGLSICKSLVDAMGGQMGVNSTLNKGSEFYCIIPFQKAAKKQDSEYLINNEILRGKKVIIVDDVEVIRKVHVKCCESLGMDIIAAEISGQKVLEKMETLKEQGVIPDLILCDVLMKDVDGYELSKILRSKAEFKNVKIIAVTSDSQIGQANRAKKAGFDGYLGKPLTQKDLGNIIRSVMSNVTLSKEITTRHTAREKVCSKTKVLVVEDRLPNQMLLREYLNDMGIEGTYMENGQQALRHLRENPDYSLILMDLHMPVMGGIEATRIIRQEISKDIPIIALTAAVFNEDRAKAFDVGMNDFLTKPVDPDKLIECVKKHSSDKT
jgi:PAS domain S-box-containing protein